MMKYVCGPLQYYYYVCEAFARKRRLTLAKYGKMYRMRYRTLKHILIDEWFSVGISFRVKHDDEIYDGNDSGGNSGTVAV